MIYLAILKRIWPVLVLASLLGLGYSWHIKELNAAKTALNDSWQKKIDEVRVDQLETEKRLLESVIKNQKEQERIKQNDKVAYDTLARNVSRLYNSLDQAAKSNTAITTSGTSCRTDGAELDSVFRESVQENLYLAKEATTLQRRLRGLQLYVKDLERIVEKYEPVLR